MSSNFWGLASLMGPFKKWVNMKEIQLRVHKKLQITISIKIYLSP